MLNKKALRTFASANPAPAISPGHGLLHTTQVEYIIRTAVRIIDHRRMLILYVYPRAQAVQGNFTPLWTMFQCKDDYITLARRPDGTTYWRKASFERLSDDYCFTLKCAFYSGKDQERVSRYFKSDAPGLKPLLWAQGTILWNRQKKRERERDKIVRARMKCLPALPHGLATWAHMTIMPAYFIYGHARGGKATGICSSCGQEASLTEVKHNAKGVCPHCGREVTMKPRGRIGRLYDRETFQILQRAKTGELAVRIMKATCAYYGDHPGTVVYESARQFVSLDEGGAIHCDRYYYAHSDSRWKHGDRPELYPYQYNFEGDTCGHVYCGNLPKALRGTPWQYCPVQQFYEHSHAPMRMYPFLTAHIQHPKLEHLVKVGFYDLVSDVTYRSSYGQPLDESQNRTHRILGVGAEDVDFLRGLDVDLSALKTFRGYCSQNLKGRQQLLAWQLHHEVEFNIDAALEYMTAHKLMRYMDAQYSFLQFRLTQYKAQRYRSMQNLVTEYKDYLDMCVKQNYDMTNSFVLYPKDLQKAHDQLSHRIQLKADAKLRRDFKAAMRSISKHLDFELDGMRIIVPSSPDEIIAEGHALHHCVGTYVDKVAKHTSIILFLRLSDNVEMPFYTIEVKEQKAVQVRGMQNADMTPAVERFIRRWERQVLQRQDVEAAFEAA